MEEKVKQKRLHKMHMENRCVTSVEGIIDEDVDQSIRKLPSPLRRAIRICEPMLKPKPSMKMAR